MENHPLLFSILIGMLCSFIFIHGYAMEPVNTTPEGYWKVVDGSGNPKTIVKIWKMSNQQLMGKVIKIYARKDKTRRCIACTGQHFNQPILGMTILSGLKSKHEQWSGGQILNPENGKTYSCAIRAIEHGNKLVVRNYIGLPYFGRAETWERVDLLSG